MNANLLNLGGRAPRDLWRGARSRLHEDDEADEMAVELFGNRYLGDACFVTVSDRLHNAALLATAKTRFKVGDTAVLNGHRVRVTVVMPRGFITWSASRGMLSRKELGPVTCSVNTYRYEAVNSRAGGSPSGQTTEDQFSR